MGGQWAEEGMPQSNLQCFLDCTTPTVETHILPKVKQLLPVTFSPLMFCGISGVSDLSFTRFCAPLSAVGEKMGVLLLVTARLFY